MRLFDKVQKAESNTDIGAQLKLTDEFIKLSTYDAYISSSPPVQRPSYMALRPSDNIKLENVKMSTYRQTKAITQKNMHAYNKIIKKNQAMLPSLPPNVPMKSPPIENVDGLNIFRFKTNFKLFTLNIEAKGLPLEIKDACVDQYSEKHELNTDIVDEGAEERKLIQKANGRVSVYQQTEGFSSRTKNSNTKAWFNIRGDSQLLGKKLSTPNLNQPLRSLYQSRQPFKPSTDEHQTGMKVKTYTTDQSNDSQFLSKTAITNTFHQTYSDIDMLTEIRKGVNASPMKKKTPMKNFSIRRETSFTTQEVLKNHKLSKQPSADTQSTVRQNGKSRAKLYDFLTVSCLIDRE